MDKDSKILRYSLILPTCNRFQLIPQFLQSVEKQTILPYEVIVIDQSDDKKTQNIFEEWNPPRGNIKKKYVHRKIKSLILARHIGIDSCDDTDLVVFFDDDITLDYLFCEEILKVFEKDTQCQYAGGMGTVDGWVYRRKPFQAFFLMPHEGDGKFLASGSQTFPHWKKEFCDTEFVSGGCTFWRREIIEKYRFDERLRGYAHGDDVDVSYRISRDYKLFFQPKSICYQEKDPPGRVFRRKYRRVWIQNMYYLAQKNKFSILAYFWCVLGHFLRDLVCLDFLRFLGDIEGTWKVLHNRIDTVVGYDDFRNSKLKEKNYG